MSEHPATTDVRREERYPVRSVVMPFLGSREQDFFPFQYLLHDMSHSGVKILLPDWLSKREHLAVDDLVDFHVPFRFEGRVFTRGRIAWARWDEEQNAQACGARMELQAQPLYPVVLSTESDEVSINLAGFSSMESLMARVVKDSILLKRGVLIYLKHLAPYLSRVSDADREEYGLLRAYLLDDMRDAVQANLERLKALRREFEKGECTLESIQACVNLDDLLSVMEPELHADLITLAFGRQSVAPYVRAIKQLEKKLYSNYNTMVLIYIHYL
jgi:hypothetical protein